MSRLSLSTERGPPGRASRAASVRLARTRRVEEDRHRAVGGRGCPQVRMLRLCPGRHGVEGALDRGTDSLPPDACHCACDPLQIECLDAT
jgi:hypothetical protein